MKYCNKSTAFSVLKGFLLVFLVFLSLSCYAHGSKEENFVKAFANPSLSAKEKLRYYTKAIKSKNPYIAEKAAIESVRLCSKNENLGILKILNIASNNSLAVSIELCEYYLQTANLYEAEKVFFTKLKNNNDENYKVKIQTLYVRILIAQKKDYKDALIDLFTMNPIENAHLFFNTENFFSQLPPFLSLLLQLRFAVYAKNYIVANNLAEAFIETAQLENKNELLYKRQVLSDIGKAFLYGSSAKDENASFFETLARMITQEQNEASNYELSFIAHFYAARLLEKRGPSFNREVLALYEISWKDGRGADFDNALWYYLNLLEKIAPFQAIEKIKETIDLWFDVSYFSDILERLCYRLLAANEWEAFYDLYLAIEGKADSESQARFAYLCARLLQENLLAVNNIEKNTRIDALFSKAFYENHSSLYYRILAAEKLDIPIEDTESSLYNKNKAKREQSNKKLEEALFLYAKYGLFDLVYEEFFKKPKEISLQTAVSLAKSFANKGDEYGKLYPMSIRLAIRSANSRDEALSKDILEAMYPRFFSKEIAASGQEFALEEYLLYALVRSESLFEKDVVSFAGAIGLAQLMKPTAGDIARKLKIADYDLLDASTNTRFGAFYLRELLGRLDDSVLLSLSSYNAGITRVRNWARDNTLPPDLFLETLPFAETREYGKKILSAAAMYGYLYYGATSHEIVAAILH